MRRIVAGGLCMLALTFASNALCATQEWTFPLPEGNGGVVQVFTDDVGGVAFTYQADGALHLVWLDSKGSVILQREFASLSLQLIMGVNNRTLVLDASGVTTPGATVIVLERNGTQATAPNVGTANLPMANRFTDLNGFCAILQDEVGNNLAVARYKY